MYNIGMYQHNLSNKSGIPAIVVSNLTNSKYTRSMKAINTDMFLYNLSEKSDTKNLLPNIPPCIVSDVPAIKSNFQLCNVSDIAVIKSNNLSISADNSIQDPIINLMTNIHPCFLLDVAGIKSNTVNSSDYNSIQDPKFKYKSDFKSNSIKKQ